VGAETHNFTNLVCQIDRRCNMNNSLKRGSLTNKAAGVALAASAAALFASTAAAPVFADEGQESKQVKCMGINACKGQGKCQTATNACAGHNSCKGMGWLLSPSAKACEEQGGKVIE
jgi:uncharacterized membrane protein